MKFNGLSALFLTAIFMITDAIPIVPDARTISKAPSDGIHEVGQNISERAAQNGGNDAYHTSQILETRTPIPGVAPCTSTTDTKKCFLQSNWDQATNLDTLYLFNHMCNVVGEINKLDIKKFKTYDFDSGLPYVVVITQWGPTGLPTFKYAGATSGWETNFYQQYLLDGVYSYIASFGC